MGYDIIYEGTIRIEPTLDESTALLIQGLAETRRVVYNIPLLVEDGYGTKESLGVEGEFFVLGDTQSYEQEWSPYVINPHVPPSTQPDLYSIWDVSKDKRTLIWNRQERSYSGHEWLVYIVKRILEPKGYNANGVVNWLCEREGKFHTIIENNRVLKKRGYSKRQDHPDVSAWLNELILQYEEAHESFTKQLIKERVIEQRSLAYHSEACWRRQFFVFLEKSNAQYRVTLQNGQLAECVFLCAETEDTALHLPSLTPVHEDIQKECFSLIQQLIPEWYLPLQWTRRRYQEYVQEASTI